MGDHVVLPRELFETNRAGEHFDVLLMRGHVMPAEVAYMRVHPRAYLAAEHVLALLNAIISHGLIGLLVVAAHVPYVIFPYGRREDTVFPVGLRQIGYLAAGEVQIVLFQLGGEELSGQRGHQHRLRGEFVEAVQWVQVGQTGQLAE